jgi:hypothetical protein
MKDLISGLVWAGIFIAAASAWGYFRALGTNAVTKHKKVCDVCFRDIQRVNEALRRNSEVLDPKGDPQ